MKIEDPLKKQTKRTSTPESIDDILDMVLFLFFVNSDNFSKLEGQTYGREGVACLVLRSFLRKGDCGPYDLRKEEKDLIIKISGVSLESLIEKNPSLTKVPEKG